MPAVSYGCCVHIAPCSIGNSHCLQLIDLVDLARGNAFIIAINGSLDESSSIVSLEALDDALVIWLDVGSEIRCKILDSNAFKIWRDNMAREVVLQEKYLPVCLQQFLIPFLKPVLIQLRGHPGFCVVMVIKS